MCYDNLLEKRRFHSKNAQPLHGVSTLLDENGKVVKTWGQRGDSQDKNTGDFSNDES